MAETDVRGTLQKVHLLNCKFVFIIGKKDSWVREKDLKKILEKYFPNTEVLELDGGHLLNETHAEEITKLISKN